MNSSGKLSYLFRKYSLLRASMTVLVIAIILIAVSIFTKRNKPVPCIESIVPPVGAPGDIITINGSNFGDIRDISYVEFAGAKLTASSYISWKDDCIKIVLPTNVQDGLVVVCVQSMRSKPALFTNEIDIPIPVPAAEQSTKPMILAIDSSTVDVGELITITGSNFGDAKNQSKVLFSIDYDKELETADYITTDMFTKNMIPVSEFEYGYEYWSNTEIKVRVPDGASSGVIVVDNGREKSEPKPITVSSRIGKKSYQSKQIYLIQYTADVTNVVAGPESTITLRCPIPTVAARQPIVELTEVVPEPLLSTYQNNLIHQISKNNLSPEKNVFSQTFVLTVYETNTVVNQPKKIVDFSDMNKNFRKDFLTSNKIIVSDSKEIQTLANKIVQKVKNPYEKAKLIYDYMCKSFEILPKPSSDSENSLAMLETLKGDAYDFSVIYTSLLRACEVPAIVNSGILINKDLSCQPHWWCEVYIAGLGWIPVDVALGAGMEYGEWDVLDRQDYYFGNLDSHRICFTRGLTEQKPFAPNSKIVYYPKSFALQTIWEEASEDVTEYSSFWSVPVVKGVY